MQSVLPYTVSREAYSEMKDVLLVDHVKAGDREAYTELVRRHEKVLLRVIVKMTKDLVLSEDVVQEALLKAYVKIHLFRGQSSFKSWAIKIAINTAKNKLRSKKRIMLDIENVPLSVPSKVENIVFHDTVKGLVRELVETLPDKQKRALVLRMFNDLTFKEIAQLMNCPYDTAKANYRHALLKLRGRMRFNKNFKGWEDLTA